MTPNFHRRYVSLNRHPLPPCLFCLHICPASYDPAPAVFSVLTTQSGPVHDLRAPRRTSIVLSAFLGHPGTTCPGIIERLPGQEFATPSTWDTSWSLSAFASNRAGTMPFSCKLRGRKVGSKNPQPNWLVMLYRQRECSSPEPVGASGNSWPRNQLCSLIIRVWLQQVLVMGSSYYGKVDHERSNKSKAFELQ